MKSLSESEGKYLLVSVKTNPQPVHAPLVMVGCEATSKAKGQPQPSRNTGKGKTGRVNANEPLLRLRHVECRYDGKSGIVGHRATSTPRDWSTTPRPRSREGTPPSCSSQERNMITPMKSATCSQAAVAQPQGRGNSSAGSGCAKKRKPVAERHREFRTYWIGEYPSRQGADVEQEAARTAKEKSSARL